MSVNSTFFTLEVRELRHSNNVYSLKVRWFNTISDVKHMLEKILNFPAARMRLLHHHTKELGNHMTLRELGIEADNQTIMLSYEFGASGSSKQNMIEPMKDIPVECCCRDMILEVQQGLSGAYAPSKTDVLDCTGGVYFFKSTTGSIAAVFKPQDEEQGMPNNPKGHAGDGIHGLRAHFKPGEGYVREYAAYVLDYNHFCQVPETIIAYCEHPIFHYPRANASLKSAPRYPKVGSLQRYVRAGNSFEDISPSLIGTLELQKIALLDLRLLNCDRNAANILAVKKTAMNANKFSLNSNGICERRTSRSSTMTSWENDGDQSEIDLDEFMHAGNSWDSKKGDQYSLVPIDHGYCLPQRLLIEEFDWSWFYSPHVSLPVDPEIISYMNSLDLESLIAKLQSEVNIPEDSIFLLRVAHHLILHGINNGWTLRQIAELVARTEDGVPSPLEKAINYAEENAHRAFEIRESYYGKGHSTESSTNVSPRRRAASPSAVSSLLYTSSPLRSSNDEGASNGLRRVVKSELNLDGIANAEARSFGGSRSTSTAPSNVTTPCVRMLPTQHEDDSHDYFMKDLGDESSDHSPTIRVLPFPIGAPAGGDPLRRLQTMDSAGIVLNGSRSNSASKSTSKSGSRNSSKPNSKLSSKQNSEHKLDEHIEDVKRMSGARSPNIPIRNTNNSQVKKYNSNWEPQIARGSTDTDYTSSESSSSGAGTSPRSFTQSLLSTKLEQEEYLVEGSMVAKPIQLPKGSEIIPRFSNNNLQNTTYNNSNKKKEGFDPIEVKTTAPLVFEKFKDVSTSHDVGCEGDGEASSPDATSGGSTPSDVMFEQAALHAMEDFKRVAKVNIDGPPSLARVVSFNAFESPALYESLPEGKGNQVPRQFHHLRREKRKLAAKSPEFQQMRLQFVYNVLHKLITPKGNNVAISKR